MTKQNEQFSVLLQNIADSLDIPESRYEEAVSRYEAVGKWLDAVDSQLHVYRPTVTHKVRFALAQ